MVFFFFLSFFSAALLFGFQALLDAPLPAKIRQHVSQEAQGDISCWGSGAQHQAAAAGEPEEGGGLAARPDQAAERGQEGHEVQQEKRTLHQ